MSTGWKVEVAEMIGVLPVAVLMMALPVVLLQLVEVF